MSEEIAVEKITAQTAYQGGVLIKLLIFSIALAVAPISTYFLSKDYLWDGNTTLAAITAIISANIVLVSYIVMAVLEERTLSSAGRPSTSKQAESKKER